MTEAPPSRYRVVERGRRLEVIDTATGESTRGASMDGEPRGWPDLPLSRGFDPPPSTVGLMRAGARIGGGRTLTTNALYDAKGPRTLTLDRVGTKVFGRATLVLVLLAMILVLVLIWQPWVLFLPIIALSQTRARNTIRHAVATWLDRYDTRGE